MPIFQDFFSSGRSLKSEKKSSDPSETKGPETLPVKMNLEERMAFRRELLFETVRATLNACYIDTHTYHFKVMRTDKRGHCYVVMLDMSPTFMESEQGQHKALAQVAALLTKNAHDRYGLVIGGVYWREDETLAANRVGRTSPASALSVQPPEAESSLSSIEKYERATAEQLAEFEAAWHKDNDVQIGDRTYSSDLAPLGDDPPLK